jgi:UDP:flavonoid glycosyltransferase YjiC (YdhE family)
MATPLMNDLVEARVDLVVSDVLTASGGMAAEKLGLPWVELLPHPLYSASKSLPPLGSGLAPGVGPRGRLRDSVMRTLTARSIRQGQRERGAARETLGLPFDEPGPAATLVATIPALEVPRTDWPSTARLVGPLLWEPTNAVLEPPPGDDPLVMISPSTAITGAKGMVEAAVEGLRDSGVRVIVSMVDDPPKDLPPWVVAGLGRQDVMLRDARVVVCGGGHGMLSKALTAGVPVVTIPGGGDQWELANRAARQGSAVLVRPLTPESVGDAVRTVLTDPSYAAAAARAARDATAVKDPVAVCRSVFGGR